MANKDFQVKHGLEVIEGSITINSLSASSILETNSSKILTTASKNSAYNKNFGGTGSATTVSRSDHTHSYDNYGSFNIQANGGTQVAISSGEEINFINGNATTAVVVNQTNPTVTFNHNDTSTQTSLTALTGVNVVSDIDLDTYGHVTNLDTRDMTEDLQDLVGAMMNVSSAQSGMGITYNDSTGKIDFDLSHTHSYDNYSGWDLYVETVSKGRISSAENVDFVGGTGIGIVHTTTNTNTVTFNHSNSVSADTAEGTATTTLSHGGTFTVPTVTYDAQGHITSWSTNTLTLPSDNNTTNFNIQANAGTQVNISAGEEINFINGNATTAVVVNQTNPTVTFNHNDTSTQTSLTALTGVNVVSDIDLDTYGHVTNLDTRDMTEDLQDLVGAMMNVSSAQSGMGITYNDSTGKIDFDLSHTHTFASLTSKPITISGYGIVDAVEKYGTLVENRIPRVYAGGNAIANSDYSTTDMDNWETAYGWGDHDGLYAPLSHASLTNNPHSVNWADDIKSSAVSTANTWSAVQTFNSSATIKILDSGRLWLERDATIWISDDESSSTGSGLLLDWSGYGYIINTSSILYILNDDNSDIVFGVNEDYNWRVDASENGAFRPDSDSTYDIGTNSVRVLTGYFDNVNTTKISNLTSNGFVKTSGSNGTLSIDTNTYSLSNHTHSYDNYGGWDLYVETVSKGRISAGENVDFVGGGAIGIAHTTTNTNTITISHSDTSSQASLTALTGANVVSDIDLDTYGHVTNIATRAMTLANLGYSVPSATLTAGTGLSGTTYNPSTSSTFSLNFAELTDMTADVVGSQDELILMDSSNERRKLINEIKLGQFNNDQNWTSNTGTITAVNSGNGMSFTNTSSGSVTIILGTPTGLSASSMDLISTNSHSHSIATTTGATASTILATNASSQITCDTTGNAATATTASQASFSAENSDILVFPLFVNSSISPQAFHYNMNLSYNASTGVLSASGFRLFDNEELVIGSGSDFSITHNGTNSLIDNNTGNLLITSAGNIQLSDLTSNGFLKTGSSNGTLSVDTNSYAQTDGTGASGSWGINITGNASTATTATNANNIYRNASGDTLSFAVALTSLGSGNNGAVYTDTSLSFNSSTNTLTTTTFSGALSGNASTASWADTVDVNDSSSSSWYDLVWHSSDTLYSADGIQYQASTDSLRFADNSRLYLGAGSDLSTYHDGSHSYFVNATGNLYVRTSGSTGLYFGTGNSNRWYVGTTGHFIPAADSTYDIGTSSVRARNTYTDTVRAQEVIIVDSSNNDKFKISYNATTDSLDTEKL
jgi:hypothetical protein